MIIINNALEIECGLKPLYLRREELILKYWTRSSPSGPSLPVNHLLGDHGCFANKLIRLITRIFPFH